MAKNGLLHWIVIGAGIVYLANLTGSIDFIPDFMPVVGNLDEFIVSIILYRQAFTKNKLIK